ncbi:hypothetical protein D6C85_04489 [Aureobasidium pullulans]|uniref:Uncharacterized protein n=1 Tax=Aureobasidium pullulans TaxID=5580 RepID=A0A4V4KYB5_AURPU|nr:hypothetical protein D6C85_04489 [Aureobasidium pullulans]
MFDSPVLGSMDIHTAILQEVAKRHADLINGLNAMYATLIEMRYLREDEVLYPPYGVSGKPAVAVQQLQAAGFVPEAIALMELLPYPSNEALEYWSDQEEGVPIAPDSGAMSYLEGHEWDNTIATSRQPLRGGETGLPAWAFKITFCGRGWGTEYIYDTRDQRMRRWASKSEHTEYEHQPNRATEESWNLLRNEVLSLDWIPWRDEGECYQTLNLHARPSLLSGVGAGNRYEENAGETEMLRDERAKLKQHIEAARMRIPALNAALRSGRERSGTTSAMSVEELKQLAAEHRIAIEHSPTREVQPEGWGIGMVLDGVEQNAPDNKALRQKILSMRHASAQQLRETAIEYGCPIPEVPAPPPAPLAPLDSKLEVAKAVQNTFACKRQLFQDCGWGEEFRGDEFERRREELLTEYHSFFSLLGPRGQNIHDLEEGAWLRDWFRQKAGEKAV